MKLSKFLDHVRRSISDSKIPYRWTNETIVDYVNDGIIEIYTYHPECVYVSAVSTAEPVELKFFQLNHDVPITNFFINALEHYVAYRCLSEDSEDNANMALAGDHYKLFLGGM